MIAIKNQKYINPIKYSEKVILNTAILISDRCYRYYLNGINIWKRLDNDPNKNICVLIPILKKANIYESIAIINKNRYYLNKIKFLISNTFIEKDCNFVEDKINIIKGILPERYNQEKYLNMIKINNPNNLVLFEDDVKEKYLRYIK